MDLEWLLDLIVDNNPIASILTEENVVFGEPVPQDASTGFNTNVLVTGVPGKKILGSVRIYYNRRSLNYYSRTTVVTTNKQATINDILDTLNPLNKHLLTVNDILPVTIPAMQDGVIAHVTLTAKPGSYSWAGSIDVTLYKGTGGKPIEETLLDSILLLDQKLTNLSNDVVHRVDGKKGIVTKEDLTIDLVDNTPDTLKPVSIPQQIALNEKVNLSSVAKNIINRSNEDMYLGQPVYMLENNDVDFAVATNAVKSVVCGLVMDTVILSQGGAGKIQTVGIITATHDQWVKATGMVGGLIPGADYYVDIVAGKITPFPTLQVGIWLCPVGTALTSAELSINIERTITL